MSRSIVEMFWEGMPRGYMRAVTMGLPDAFRHAYDDTFARREPPEAINLIPFERRANIQELLRSAAEFHDGQVLCEAIQGEDGSPNNWWYYSKTTAGRVIMTSVSAKHPNELVRASESRLQYSANTYRQRFLWKEGEPVRVKNWSVYALLLVGHEPRNSRELAFAVVRFPLPDYRGYYEQSIDLMREFRDGLGGAAQLSTDPHGGSDGDIELLEQDEKA